MTGRISILAGALVLTAGFAGAAAAQGSVASPDISCQRTIDTNDYAGVCCRLTAGGRTKYVRTNRKTCLEKRGAVASRSLCPRRPRSTSPDSWVCCETDTTPGLGARIVGKRISHALMPAETCRKRDRSKVVARQHCVRKRTRRDRMIECRGKGEGWRWNGSRCVRENLRDRRK